jgi:hypothetical protein
VLGNPRNSPKAAISRHRLPAPGGRGRGQAIIPRCRGGGGVGDYGSVACVWNRGGGARGMVEEGGVLTVSGGERGDRVLGAFGIRWSGRETQ